MFTDGRTYVRTDGQTTDGRQAHRYKEDNHTKLSQIAMGFFQGTLERL